MRIGIGLPSSVPGTTGEMLVSWASEAEDASFASLGVVERVRYDAYEPLTVLAAAAAVTRRVELVTMVVIGPLRSSGALSVQAGSVHALSGGRLVLGLSVGARTEDYDAAGVPSTRRGERLSHQLIDLRESWDGGPRLLVGGASDEAFARVGATSDGYVHGGGPPRTFARAVDKVRAAWAAATRPGRPELWAQTYFALGDSETVEKGREYMLDYYAFTGPFAERIAEGLLTTPHSVAQLARGYAEAGCDHLVFLPAVAEIGQIGALAGVVAEL